LVDSLKLEPCGLDPTGAMTGYCAEADFTIALLRRATVAYENLRAVTWHEDWCAPNLWI